MEKIVLYRRVDDVYIPFGSAQVTTAVAQHLAPDGYGAFLPENWPMAFSYRDDSSVYMITELTLLEWLKHPASAKEAYKNCLLLAAISDDVDLAEFLKHSTPTRVLNAVRVLIQIAFEQTGPDDRVELARLIAEIMKAFVTNLLCGDYCKDNNFKSGNRCVSMLLRLKFLISEDVTMIETVKMLASNGVSKSAFQSTFCKMRDMSKTVDETIERLKSHEIEPARYENENKR